MYKYIIAFALLITHAEIFAALPPLFENIAEIKAILDDQRLGDLLESGETIKEIKKVEKGYIIKTNQHKLLVRVVYKPISMPGPAKFDLEFKTPKPLRE